METQTNLMTEMLIETQTTSNGENCSNTRDGSERNTTISFCIPLFPSPISLFPFLALPNFIDIRIVGISFISFPALTSF